MPSSGPQPDLVDETFIVAPPSALQFLCDERTWAQWFPGILLTCTEDRGLRGKRWSMSGELEGSAEVWVEQAFDGVVVHIYLRSLGSGQGPGRFAQPLKHHMFDVKDLLEAGRRPGEAGSPAQASSLRGGTGEDHGRCGRA